MFIHTKTIELPKLEVVETRGQRFYITSENNKYPSITTVLSSEEKPWLENWRKALGKDKADKEQQRCSERGEIIHQMCEKYLMDQLNVEQLSYNYKPEYVAGFNQLKLFLNRINNIRAQEVALYSDVLRVAGRTDCVGEFDGVISIIDFKTSNNSKTKESIEDYFLQSTAYALMWYELTGEYIDDIVILMSVERGIVPLKFVEKVDKYIKPLTKRIKKYYKEKK